MKITMIFPGQGSQYVGMCKKMFNEYKVVRDVFDQASEALHVDLKALCFDGTLEQITKTEIAQPAILTTSYAMFQVYRNNYGVEPTYMLGHSLGEYSALTCAGAISLDKAVQLVQARGRIIEDSVPNDKYGMISVMNIDKDVIERECDKEKYKSGFVAISIYNTESQIVLSGETHVLNMIGHKLEELGAKIIKLNSYLPFHCELLNEASACFKEELSKYEILDPKYTVISNVTAKPYTNSIDIKQLLPVQISHAVNWKESVDYVIQNDSDIFLEMGPGKKLRNMLKRSWKDIRLFSLDVDQDIEQFASIIHCVDTEVDFGAVVTMCLTVAISTKNSNWDDDKYTKGVLIPYRRIKEIQNEIDNSKIKPTESEARECLDLLKEIFKTKFVPKEEQNERISDILTKSNTSKQFQNYIE